MFARRCRKQSSVSAVKGLLILTERERTEGLPTARLNPNEGPAVSRPSVAHREETIISYLVAQAAAGPNYYGSECLVPVNVLPVPTFGVGANGRVVRDTHFSPVKYAARHPSVIISYFESDNELKTSILE